MVSAQVTVTNRQGFHMRPASFFTQTMGKFRSSVTLRHGDRAVDGKSVMNLMAACMKQGTLLTVECDGPDEADALAAAVDLIRSGLGED